MEERGERNVKNYNKEIYEKNRVDECDTEGGEEERRQQFVLLMTITVTAMMIKIIDKI
jgi:hypothetical protein